MEKSNRMNSNTWRAISGVLCLYKHSGISIPAMKKIVRKSIVDFSAQSEPSSITLPSVSLPIVEQHEISGALVVVGHNEIADYRYHPLVCGKMIRDEDIRIEDIVPLETHSSGVCLFGLNDGCDELPYIMSRSWPNVYKIDGILGKSRNRKPPENLIDLSSISRHKLEKVISILESQFKALTFKNANVDMESEKAFELARKGLPRAQLPGAQNIYSIELNWFRNPRFSVTVQTCGESDEMLRTLIENIGTSLGTCSLTLRLQRQVFGPFTSDDALLEKQISFQNIIRNIQLNNKIIEKDKLKSDDIVEKVDLTKVDNDKAEKDLFDGLGLTSSTSLEEYDAMRPAWPRNYN